MTEQRPKSSFIVFLDTAGKAWALILGAFTLVAALIGWGYSMSNNVSTLQTNMSTIINDNFPSRVQALEEQQANENQNMTQEIQDLKSQISSLESDERGVTSSQNVLSQQVAILGAKSDFIITQIDPGAKVPQK